MNREIIAIENEQQWLAERTKDITSTEVSALYGLSPYKTEFELFHEKREGVVVKFPANERMKWGTRLESIIAQGAAEDQGWEIGKLNVYMRDTAARIGSSFDFEILSSANGKGILEIKNVDGLQYYKNWIDDGAGNIDAPEHIEMHIQHQMEVSGYEWTALVALVGGNELKVIYRNRDSEIGKDIRSRVAAFWDAVQKNTPPSADYTRDAEFIIKQLHANANPGEEIDVSNDPALEDLVKQYRLCSQEYAAMDKLKDQYKAQLLERIGTASKVYSSIGTISCGNVSGSAGTLITPEMVGTTIGTRAGYRSFRFTPKKEK
jgi:putative phage-type endonuclease